MSDGLTNKRYGRLVVPAGALLPPISDAKSNLAKLQDDQLYGEIAYKLLRIDNAPESRIYSAKNVIHPAHHAYTSSIFKVTDAALESFHTVRSPVVELSAVERPKSMPYRFPLVIQLNVDYVLGSTLQTDYCLAKLHKESGSWNCTARDPLSIEDGVFSFPLSEDGIYTVIFNPKPPVKLQTEASCDLICRYKWRVIFFATLILIIGGFIGFILWRLLRFVAKYQRIKGGIMEFQDHIRELKNGQTDVIGQTLGDKIEGINFAYNPMADFLNAGNSRTCGDVV
jgi:hypothetical protein